MVNTRSTSSSQRNETKSKPLPEKSERSKSTLTIHNSSSTESKYLKAKYIKIFQDSIKPFGPKVTLEVEGIPLVTRGSSKGISYFECASRRQRNTPECTFRGRSIQYDVEAKEGEIEIIQDHSLTCKYLPGNDVKDFNKNSNCHSNKMVYKLMKLEIEKKLEDESWLTPKEVLDWNKDNFSIDKHLSYSQIDDIVQCWRKKNSATKDTYIDQHPSNRVGLPFLRTHFTFNYKKNDTNKTAKIVIWTSDFQLNRLRLTNHWYTDGTFTIAPSNYHQFLTIAIRDPNTGFIKPALWAILDSKEEESYYQAFRIIKDIASNSGRLDWNLTSITLDFEPGLINGFKRVFLETRVIGCLFHFKQALYREAKIQGLTIDKLKETSKELIHRLGLLSWKGNLDLVEKELEMIQKKYEHTVHQGLVLYYKNWWLDRLKSGLIDYSHIEDNFRTNSVLEGYNGHVKDSLPRSPSWPKFLEFLLCEEESYVKESFLAEQKGQTLSKSVNFGKVYLPKPLHQKRVKVMQNKDQRTPKHVGELLVDEKDVEKGKGNVKGKRKIDQDTNTSINEVEKDLKKVKKVSNRQKDTSVIKKYVYNTRNAQNKDPNQSKTHSDEEHQTDDTVDDRKGFSWIAWQENSCRYDCFLSLYTLRLHTRIPDFDEKNADAKHRYQKQYISLFQVANALKNADSMEERGNIVMNFWDEMYKAKIDENPIGKMGFVQELLALFLPLFSIQPFLEEERTCGFCGYKELVKKRWPLPIKIHETGNLNFSSIQQYYNWFVGYRPLEHCEACLQDKLENKVNIAIVPKIIVIEFIPTTKQRAGQKKSFEYSTFIESKNLKSKHSLIATINNPTPLHFNCAISEPLNTVDKKVTQGWSMHDGLQNSGKVTEVTNMSEIWSQKPIILIYKNAK